MTLSELIKNGPRKIATAIGATGATEPTVEAHSVATIARIAVANTRKSEIAVASGENLFDAVMEARRQKVLAMLADYPAIKRAILTDTEADPENVIVTVGLRDQATGELAIPKTNYDPLLILKLIEPQPQEPS